MRGVASTNGTHRLTTTYWLLAGTVHVITSAADHKDFGTVNVDDNFAHTVGFCWPLTPWLWPLVLSPPAFSTRSASTKHTYAPSAWPLSSTNHLCWYALENTWRVRRLSIVTCSLAHYCGVTVQANLQRGSEAFVNIAEAGMAYPRLVEGITDAPYNWLAF